MKSSLLGVESLFSRDDVLGKRYRGKLEHRETNLFEAIPQLCHVDWLVLNPALVTLALEGSSATVGERPLVPQLITTVSPSLTIDPGRTKVVGDSKYGIVSDVRQAMDKTKAILAMEEVSSDVINIGRHIESRRILFFC